MTEFFDSAKKSWAVNITLGSAKRVLEKTGIDLLNPISFIELDEKGNPLKFTSTASRLLSDDILIGDIVVALIQRQANDRGLSEDDLRELFDGETLKNAQAAFLKEYHNFFMARGNLPAARMIETFKKTAEKIADEESLGEILSDLQDEPDSQTSTT